MARSTRAEWWLEYPDGSRYLAKDFILSEGKKMGRIGFVHFPLKPEKKEAPKKRASKSKIEKYHFKGL